MSQDASIMARLGLDTAGFRKGLGEASGQVTSFGKDMLRMATASLSVGSVAAFAKEVIDMAGTLQDSSDAIGINVVALQELNAAFSLSGASAQQVEKGLAKLSETTIEARGGNEKLAAAFETLGVSGADLASMSLDEVVMQIARSANSAQDPAERLSAIIDVLGKSGLKMAAGLNSGADAIGNLRKQAATLSEKDIKALDDAGDLLEVMARSVKVSGAKLLVFDINEYRKLLDPLGHILGRYREIEQSAKAAGEEGTAQANAVRDAELERIAAVNAAEEQKATIAAQKAQDAMIAAMNAREAIAEKARQATEDEAKLAEDRWKEVQNAKIDAARKSADEQMKLAEKTAEKEKKLAEEVAEKKAALIEEIQKNEIKRQEAVAAQREEDRQDFIAEKMAGPDARREAERDRKEAERLGRRFEREQALAERGGRSEFDATRGDFMDELKGAKERGWEELQRQVERDRDKADPDKDLAAQSLTQLEKIAANTANLGKNL